MNIEELSENLTMQEAWLKIRTYRFTRELLFRRTELRPDDTDLVYWRIMKALTSSSISNYRCSYAPIMRVASDSKHLDWDISFPVISNGRIIFYLLCEGVGTYASFDFNDFIRYALLSSMDLTRYGIMESIRFYLSNLRNELIEKYYIRRQYAPVKAFTFSYYERDNESIRIKVAQALSLALSLKSKKRIREKKHQAIIIKFYTEYYE